MRSLFGILLLFLCLPAHADFSHVPQVPKLLSVLQHQDGFTKTQLAEVRRALAQAQFLPQLIHSEKYAKERTLTWDEYAPIHLNPANIAGGLAFLHRQRRWLDRARVEYGVPPEVVTALLGVESKYGRYTGRVRVLDALATMAFKLPSRSAFFLGELRSYFVLCRDDGLDPTALRGSYAGAMGDVQFMPSNVLRLGIDFNHDGHLDLWSPADAIGSVANYLAHYDPARAWQRGMPMMVSARVPEPLPDGLHVNPKRTDTTVAALRAAGVRPAHALPGDLKAGLVRLDGSHGPQDWIALNNFYAIMSYNPRIFYAMAVAQLAEALDRAERSSRTASR